MTVRGNMASVMESLSYISSRWLGNFWGVFVLRCIAYYFKHVIVMSKLLVAGC